MIHPKYIIRNPDAVERNRGMRMSWAAGEGYGGGLYGRAIYYIYIILVYVVSFSYLERAYFAIRHSSPTSPSFLFFFFGTTKMARRSGY